MRLGDGYSFSLFRWCLWEVEKVYPLLISWMLWRYVRDGKYEWSDRTRTKFLIIWDRRSLSWTLHLWDCSVELKRVTKESNSVASSFKSNVEEEIGVSLVNLIPDYQSHRFAETAQKYKRCVYSETKSAIHQLSAHTKRSRWSEGWGLMEARPITILCQKEFFSKGSEGDSKDHEAHATVFCLACLCLACLSRSPGRRLASPRTLDAQAGRTVGRNQLCSKTAGDRRACRSLEGLCRSPVVRSEDRSAYLAPLAHNGPCTFQGIGRLAPLHSLLIHFILLSWFRALPGLRRGCP
jgi:hypothetical protein